MADREIKTRLKLEGESEFRKGMRDAASAVKVLNSEEKLAEAQFDLTGDKEKYLTEKTEILRKKIDEQQKSVKTAEEALAKMKKQGFDPNNKAVLEWTVKLNSAKAALSKTQGGLANLERGLDSNGKELKSAGEKADEYAEKLQQIGQGINWQNTVSALQGVSSMLDTAFQKVVQISSSITAAMREAAQWADDVMTSAMVANLDPETYQAWQVAAKQMDVSVEDIISARKKLFKAMTSDNKDTALMFNQLGVVVRDSDGDLRDMNDVFWETIDALSRIKNEGKQSDLAQDLFGKGWDTMSLLYKNGGKAAWDSYVESAKEVAVVSEDDVTALAELQSGIEDAEERFAKLKRSVEADLAPAFSNAASLVAEIITQINSYLDSEEGQETIRKISDSINQLVEDIRAIDWEAVFSFAASCVQVLVDVFKWITEHWLFVLIAIGAIKGAAIGFEVAKSVLQFLQLVKGINWLRVAKGANGLGSALGAGGGAGAGAGGAKTGVDATGAAGAAGAGAKAGQGLSLGAKLKAAGSATLKEIGMFAASAGTVLGPGLAGIMMGLPIAIGLDKWSTSKTWGRFNEIQAGMPALLGMSGTQAMTQMQETLSDFNEIMTGDSAETVVGAQAMFQKYGQRILELLPDIDFWDAVRDKVDLSDGLNEDEIKRIVESDINAFDWIDLGKDVMEGMAAAIEAEAERNESIGQALVNGVAAGVAALSDDATATLKKSTLALSPALTGAVTLITSTAETLLSQLAAIVASAGQWSGGNISMLADGYSALSSINLPGSYITAGVDTGSSGLQFVGLGRRTQYPVTGGGNNNPTQQHVNVQMYIDRHEVARAVAPITAQTIAADLYATR